MSVTRVGIIGCGDIAASYLRLAPLFRGIDIRACADLRSEAAEERAQAFGIEARSVDALLASDDIEIIVNLTVPAAHAAVSRRCLEAGKHVYSEKPFVLSVEDGRDLIALAQARGLRIGSAPDTFLGASHQQARALIDAGAIGPVHSGTCFVQSPGMEMWHPNPDFFFKSGGGPVLDMGPYYISNLVQLLGPVKEVMGMSGAARSEREITSSPRAGEMIAVETPTTVHALLQFQSGAMITFVASWDVWDHGHAPMELYGLNGSLHVPDPNHFGGRLRLTEGRKPVDLPEGWSHPFRNQIKRMARQITVRPGLQTWRLPFGRRARIVVTRDLPCMWSMS